MRIALVTACLWAALCAPAAATIFDKPTAGSTTITVTSGDDVAYFYSYVDGTDFGFGRDASSPDSLQGTGQCGGVSPADVRCPFANVTKIVFAAGGGNDRMGFDGLPVALDGDGGIGNDEIVGTSGGGTLHGGDGMDYIDGRDGADLMFGDANDDSFGAATPGDVVNGGDGYDGIDFSSEGGGAVTITLDDVANDGRPGANANVMANVEYVSGSTFGDTLIGNTGSNELLGGDGNDEVTGGPGSDELRGDNGEDKLFADDMVEDTVDCGAGTDTAKVDSLDSVSNCETVEIVGPDADGDGVKPPLDCDDSNPNARPGGTDVPGNGADEDCNGTDAPLLDSDSDGVTSERDCDDGNPAIRPGAVDKPGNGVDEDCDGADDPFPRAAGSLKYAFRSFSDRTVADQLRVVGAAPGTRIRITCKGPCRFKKKSLTMKKGGRLSLLGRTGRSFRPGSTLEIRVLQAGAISEVRTFRFRSGRSVVVKLRCITPGSSSIHAC